MTTITEQAAAPEKLGARIKFADPVFAEVMDFLWIEASLLDSDRQLEWLDLVAQDILYTMPIRKTVHRSDGRGVDNRGGSFYDDRSALELRVRRNVVIENAYDRDPPPRTRRIVSNVVIHSTEVANEFAVESYILLLRNQFQDTGYDILSAERQDVLRLTDDGMKLARRTILIDMCVMGAAYPNVLL